MRMCRNGRRAGLRNQCLERVGSSPTSSTNDKVWVWNLMLGILPPKSVICYDASETTRKLN